MVVRKMSLLLVALSLVVFLGSCSDSDSPTNGPERPGPHSLTINVAPLNGGSVSRDPELNRYEDGAVVTLTASPNNGYRFAGWLGAPSGVSPSSQVISFGITGNLTMTAQFEEITEMTYVVAIVSAGAGATGTGSYEVGETVAISAGTPPTGQTFANWTTTSNGVIFADANSVTTSFTMPANAVTVTANFEVTQTGTTEYAVTVVSAGTGATGTGSYEPGAMVNINAGTPPTGQTFANWMTTSNGVIFADANSVVTSFIMPTNAVTVTANFTSGTTTPTINIGALRAEPVAAIPNNPSNLKVIGSWRDLDANYYLIDLGYINNAFVAAIMGPDNYDGITPIEVSVKNITTETVSNSMTQTIVNSIGFSLSSTVKYGIDLTNSIRLQISGVGDVNSSLSQKFETSITTGISATQSRTTSVTEVSSFTQSTEVARRWIIGNNGENAGWYRYALYAVSDVYLLISTSLDNQILISEEIISCGRTNEYLPYWEFAADGRFDNSPEVGKEIRLADDYYKTLPIPTVGRRKIDREIDTSFTDISGTYSFEFSENTLPATVEIYAVGGGGGGQGGYSKDRGLACITCSRPNGVYNATGGAGGGAAIATWSGTIIGATTFNITIGAGGVGGGAVYRNYTQSWQPGDKGGDGYPTTVTWGSGDRFITAAGGKGGGESGGTSGGAAGGIGGTKGTDGSSSSNMTGESNSVVRNDNLRSIGGDSEGLGGVREVNGLIANAGIGGGGYAGYGQDQDGSPGGNGKARIVIKYFEIEEL